MKARARTLADAYLSRPPDPDRVRHLVELIKPALQGEHPIIISAVLADLLAIFLASHVGKNVDDMREQILADHIKLVRSLIASNEAQIFDAVQTEGSA